MFKTNRLVEQFCMGLHEVLVSNCLLFSFFSICGVFTPLQCVCCWRWCVQCEPRISINGACRFCALHLQWLQSQSLVVKMWRFWSWGDCESLWGLHRRSQFTFSLKSRALGGSIRFSVKGAPSAARRRYDEQQLKPEYQKTGRKVSNDNTMSSIMLLMSRRLSSPTFQWISVG